MPCVAWRTALAASTLSSCDRKRRRGCRHVGACQAIRDQTGAACVAWEGSGAARAALFNGIGSLEIRAVTDDADKEAPQGFDANLPIAMANLARLLGLWFGEGRNRSPT
jgi:hypothetical protein